MTTIQYSQSNNVLLGRLLALMIFGLSSLNFYDISVIFPNFVKPHAFASIKLDSQVTHKRWNNKNSNKNDDWFSLS